MLLAIETATSSQSVALARGGEACVELVAEAGRGGAESLLALVDAALARAGVSLEAVTELAVSIGPGSFTGLRIGLATAKGLAFAARRPVAPVPTLAALAETAAALGATGTLAPLLDARRGELYAAAYEPGPEGWRELVPPGVVAIGDLARVLPRSCTLVGEGVGPAAEAALGAAGTGLRLGPRVPPRAWAVARLGARILREGGGRDAAELAPRYLRRAEAEARRTGERLEPDSTLP